MNTKQKILFTCAIALLLLVGSTAVALAVSGAVSTTDNLGFVDTNPPLPYTDQACLNGKGVNCNNYLDKRDVWLSGLPVAASLGSGTYFFAVLVPGGQGGNDNPNDGTPKNLSDDFDAYTDRMFSVDGTGAITNLGTHNFDSTNNKLQLFPYANTTNPGGVYIMAVCSLANGYPVTPSTCKYDAFKIQEGEVIIKGLPPTITKDSKGTYKNIFAWTITKDVDNTLVKQVGGSVTFNYTIKVTHDGGTISDVKVVGTITVLNPNVDNITGADVTDALSDGTVCTVAGGSNATLGPGDNDFTYECDLNALPQVELDNTATVTWPEQFLDNGALLDAGSADFTFKSISFTENPIDECVDVSDSYAGVLGKVCVGDDNPKTFTYSRIIPVPQFNCQSYDNTATFTTNDTGATGSASQTVKVCGPVKTGALTMGFWQNNNGQGIIKAGASTAGVCNSGTWLRQYAPFQDLSATATCAQVATYVTNVIKAANASGASMNKMLKAQMLATALDVYFSDPALGGKKINAPAPIGGVAIDLTKICKNIGGGCTIFEDVRSAFDNQMSMTVSQMLAYAASQSNAGGSSWYGQVKATQELAKDAFDAINNEKVFAP